MQKALAFAVLFTAACPAPTTTEVDMVRAPPEAVAPTEGGVVVLSSIAEDAPPGDVNLTRCVTRRLQRMLPAQNFVEFEVFRDALFPWLEPGHVPEDLGELNELLARPLVRERIAELGVAHIIHIGGATTTEESLDAFGCLLSPFGFGGCYGAAQTEQESRFTALVWSLTSGTEKAQVAARSSGTSAAVGFLLPLIFLARTEHEACEALSEQLGAMLRGAAPPS